MKKTISVLSRLVTKSPMWAISLLCFCLFLFPLANAGTIHITQTTGPIILGTSNTTYVLDNNVTSTGHGFIIGKSNIVLDLNGKTVTFGTDTTLHNRCGVVIPTTYARSDMPGVPDSCLTGPDTLVIKNGSLIHGADGVSCRIIYANEGVRKVEVANINGKYRGIDSEGFLFLENRDLYIHDNSIEAAMTSVSNRHLGKGAINIGGFSGGSLKVQDNTVYGRGQWGIVLFSRKSYPVTELICSGNKMSIHGITTNPIQLHITGFSKSQQGTNIQIYNNRITSPGDVSNRGLYFDAIDASFDGMDGAKVYGNYIECKEHGNLEYGEAGWTHCFRMRDQGNGVKKNFNNEFYNDTLIANGYWANSDTNGGAWAIRISSSCSLSANEVNVFRDNVIIANSADTHSACQTYAIGFEGHNKNSGTVFYSNSITSNSHFFDWNHGGGDSATFRSNTLNMGADTSRFTTIYWYNFKEGSDPDDNALGQVFLDNVLNNGITYKQMYLHGYAPRPRSFYSKWYLNVNVKDSLNQNVSNAIVIAYDKNNTLRGTDTTDANGNAKLPLTEYYFYTSGAVSDTHYTYYNPYTVIASKGGQSGQIQVVMDASKQITIRNNGENNCPSVPVLSLPVNRDTILGLRPTLVLNNSTDADLDNLTYDFQVYSDSQMTYLAASGTNITQGTNITSWQVGFDLPDENQYWWKARSYDGICYSDWSETRSFYVRKWVAGVDDSQPTIKDPTDGAVLTDVRPILETYNVMGFESLVYYFQLSSDSQFTGPIQSGPVSQGDIITRWRVPSQLSAGNYCWRTRAFDGSEFSLWSQIGKFTVSPEIHVYPNPFKPSSGDEAIIFGSIPIGSNIRVITLSGELIKRFVNTEEARVVWNAKNEEGKDVASGVYLYFVDFSGGSASGKIVVIR